MPRFEHSQSILLTLLTNSISQLSIATESTLRSINQSIYPNGVCSDTQTLGQQIKETFGIFSSSLFLHNSNKWLKLKSIPSNTLSISLPILFEFDAKLAKYYGKYFLSWWLFKFCTESFKNGIHPHLFPQLTHPRWYTVTPIPSICLCSKIKELEEYMIVRQENQISFDSFAMMMMMMMMMLDQFRSQAWACQEQARYRGQFISGGNTRIGKNYDEPPL